MFRREIFTCSVCLEDRPATEEAEKCCIQICNDCYDRCDFMCPICQRDNISLRHRIEKITTGINQKLKSLDDRIQNLGENQLEYECERVSHTLFLNRDKLVLLLWKKRINDVRQQLDDLREKRRCLVISRKINKTCNKFRKIVSLLVCLIVVMVLL